jgi:peptidoglycan DL-endopeptidase LytF
VVAAPRRSRAGLARYAAPAAFLAAVTIAVLLVRAGLDSSSPGTTTATQGRPASTATTSTTTRVRRRRYYRLRQGETISDVAVRFDTTVEQLLALNPGIKPNALEVGRRIRVR